MQQINTSLEPDVVIGIIGGSGIYEALPLKNVREEDITTPFGDPSDTVTIGILHGTEVAFLPRHGSNHRYSPSKVPYRANVHALKQIGVNRVIATNAVGSLREDLPPRTLVIPDQIFDRTKHRDSTFFGEGMAVHMGFAEPFDPPMIDHLSTAAAKADVTTEIERGGTYVCIEGPQFSTKAESEFYRSQGWDIVGMTAIPEAKLAREAQMSYATLVGVTDYDVWKDDSEVTLEEVLDNAAANRDVIHSIITEAVRTMPVDFESEAWSALDGTINTPVDDIPDSTREQVDLLLEEYSG